MDNLTEVSVSLNQLNDEQIQKLGPTIAYLVILMAIGIPGNAVVLAIYRKKYSKSVYRTIIWNLALVDLLFCTITIPFNIGRIIRYYTFTELWACKLFTGIIMILIMCSAHLLMLLSIHRFRQVCQPLQRQITNEIAYHWVAVCLVIGLCLAWPQSVLQPLGEVKLRNNLTGHICAVSRSNPSVYLNIYNGFLAFLFSSYSFILLVLYSIIGRKMYYQRTLLKDSRSAKNDDFTSKMTKIAFTISVVFAVSYVPVFVIKLFAKQIPDDLTPVQFSALRIFERSYVINHVVNPFIYAFFDCRFRRQMMNILCIWKEQRVEGSDKTDSTNRTLDTPA